MAENQDEARASTPAESAAPPASKQTNWYGRTGVQAFLGVGGFIAAVAGVVIPLLLQPEEPSNPAISPSSTSATTPPTTTVATGAPQTSGPEDRNAGVDDDVGRCLSATQTPLPCDGPHIAEVIGPASDCSKATLVRYLGGLTEVDVLTPAASVAVRDIGDSSLCLGNTETVLTAHAQDAFVQGRGDEWRWCIDDRSARNVACSEPHTAEVISEPSLDGESLDCRRRADEYAATDLSRYAFDIAVSARGPEEAKQCVIEVRTSSVLTTSLRGLRSSALPIRPA